MFLLQWAFGRTAAGQVFWLLSLVPEQVVHGYVWQLATYSFVHVGLWEILWNMLTLWMFGADIEQTWGTDRFLKFYFLCATGPALVVVLLSYLFGRPTVPTVGAYAPIYGILLVCAVLWPERQVLFIIFPMQMKWFVILVGAIALFMSLSGGGPAALGLLTGMLFGYIYLKSRRTMRMPSIDPLGSIQRGYREWKLARAKKKFQVYMRKQRSDREIN